MIIEEEIGKLEKQAESGCKDPDCSVCVAYRMNIYEKTAILRRWQADRQRLEDENKELQIKICDFQNHVRPCTDCKQLDEHKKEIERLEADSRKDATRRRTDENKRHIGITIFYTIGLIDPSPIRRGFIIQKDISHSQSNEKTGNDTRKKRLGLTIVAREHTINQ